MRAAPSDTTNFSIVTPEQWPIETERKILQGYVIIGTSEWIDDEDKDYLHEAAVFSRSKNARVTICQHSVFDHIEDVRIQRDPPAWCALPRFLRPSDCNCETQMLVSKKFFRHKVEFLE